jgi:NAD(P)-dependent dehydrogenase (short-subunit alcohol dehydrogenase family)
MDLQLTNKKALVTGATAGIGIAIASLLAQEGASVVVSGRSPQRVQQAVQEMSKTQGTDAANFEAEFFRTVRPSSLLKRFETREEVPAVVVYVCSARASATNGAALRVDGGVVRSTM